MQNQKSGMLLLVVGCVFLLGCKPDKLNIEVYTSDVSIVGTSDEVMEVPVTATFSVMGEDEENLLDKVREIALNYVSEGTEIEKTKAQFGDALIVKTKIPIGQPQAIKEFLSDKPRLLQLNVQQNEDEEFDVTVELTSYAEKFSDEISQLNFMLGLKMPAASTVIRVVGDDRDPPTVNAVAIFESKKPYLNYSKTVERRESVELDFKGGDASVYSQIPVTFTLNYN